MIMVPKALFRRVFSVALRLLSGWKKGTDAFSGPLDSICILAQEKWGDAVLLTPLINALKAARPSCRISIVTAGANDRFFAHDANVAECIQIKRNRVSALFRLRRRPFDLLFNTKDHPSITYLLASTLIRARYKVGIEYWSHHGLYHHLLQAEFHIPVIEKNCMLLPWLGISSRPEGGKPYLPGMPVSPAVEEFAASLTAGPVIGVNLSAGDPAREWPVDKWEQLLRQLAMRFVVFAMPDRIADQQRLLCLPGAIPSPSTANIVEAGRIIQRLRLLVSPDTALVHVASCTSTPVVGLYRADPIHLSRFGPHGAATRTVVSPTMFVRDIPVAKVVSAINELLAGTTPGEERNHGT